MIWHTFPHVPEVDSRIMFVFKGCKDGNYFEMKVRERENINHIEKWCYRDDYVNLIKQQIEVKKK